MPIVSIAGGTRLGAWGARVVIARVCPARSKWRGRRDSCLLMSRASRRATQETLARILDLFAARRGPWREMGIQCVSQRAEVIGGRMGAAEPPTCLHRRLAARLGDSPRRSDCLPPKPLHLMPKGKAVRLLGACKARPLAPTHWPTTPRAGCLRKRRPRRRMCVTLLRRCARRPRRASRQALLCVAVPASVSASARASPL